MTQLRHPDDLTYGTMYWPSVGIDHRMPPSPAPPSVVDAIIVGAGISGAMAGYHLARAGHSVLIVDENDSLEGSTAASTAMLLYEIDEPLASLTRQLGDAHANAAYLASYAALADLRSLLRQLDDPCDAVIAPSLYLGVKRRDARTLKLEAALRHEIGIPAEYLDREALLSRFQIDRPAAIATPGSISLNPMRFTAALLRDSIRHGAYLRGGTRFDMDNANHPPFTVTTPEGQNVRSKWLIVATGYETPRHFAEVAALTDLTSTFALVSNQLESTPWPEAALIWECSDPYLYCRTTADGRVMAGGEDEPFSDPDARDALLPSKVKRILSALHRLTPHASYDAQFAWAGTFARTGDGLPFIGPHPRWPGVLFALGYGGNGITFSLLAAQIIRDHIGGVPNANSDLFTFDR